MFFSTTFIFLIIKLCKGIIRENPQDLWENDPVECEIRTIPNSKIPRFTPYPMNPTDQKETNEIIEKLLQKNLIRPSRSPYTCSAFLVRNRGEKERKRARMVVDYKPLNKITIRDSYPLPNKDHLINKIRNAKFYSKFDCFNLLTLCFIIWTH